MKMWIVIVGVVAVLTALIIGFVLWDERRTSQRLTAEATAEGFAATPTEWYDSSKEENVKGHTLTFAYVSDGKVYTRTLEQITWYEPTETYKVCYNPADPEDAKLYTAEHKCGSGDL